MAANRKRVDLSVKDKLRLIETYDKLNLKNVSQRKAAEQLGIPQSSLSKLLKMRHEITNNVLSESRKRKREGKSQIIDAALFLWYKQASLFNVPTSRSILLQKANEFAKNFNEDFKATNGWLTRWKERNSIVLKKQASDDLSAVNWLKSFWQNVLKTYNPEDIFNTDETALYYKITPDQCITLKNSSTSACKKLKDMVTVLLTCNITGTIKRKPLIIGKSKSPICFNGVKHLPAEYASNTNAWMTASLFEDYLKKWDLQLGLLNKKIVLVLDNCPAHPKLSLENIELVFLPHKINSIIQPLNQGIIKTFKSYYRTEIWRQIIQSIDDDMGKSYDITKKITLLDALHLISRSWNEVSETCIKNCFIKSGFVVDVDVQEISNSIQVETPEYISSKDFDDWVNIDRDLQTTTALNDEEIAETASDILDMQEEDNAIEDEVERKPITKWQTREAMAVLRKALEEMGGNDSDYRHFYNVEKSILRLYNFRQT